MGRERVRLKTMETQLRKETYSKRKLFFSYGKLSSSWLMCRFIRYCHPRWSLRRWVGISCWQRCMLRCCHSTTSSPPLFQGFRWRFACLRLVYLSFDEQQKKKIAPRKTAARLKRSRWTTTSNSFMKDSLMPNWRGMVCWDSVLKRLLHTYYVIRSSCLDYKTSSEVVK